MNTRTLIVRTLVIVAILLMAYACLAAIHTGRISVGRFNARTVSREASPGKFWAYVVVCLLGTLVFAVGMIGTFFRKKAPDPRDS
jgi:H+/Cl- antiporter ClcA